ncbi:hypothetical protein RICGR_0526 [Rickettsiella grylli]|uniref:Uncharacterized protein n=1 Tax=Rickettsiella grylli TaxID=59196 RepID=A8PLT5_9COXI|nr:hypothetical protein RICGR_0526 [Rickettsiella grylli]
MTRKFLKNPMPQFSSDKKFNKTIQKIQRQKDKINTDVFKHNNLKQ